MKNIFILSILLHLFSCSKISQTSKQTNDVSYNYQQQVVCSTVIQNTIDSIVSLNYHENHIFELIVDKTVENRCNIILYKGIEPYFKNGEISLCYLLSNDKKINIYSGIESYFGLPNTTVQYNEPVGIRDNTKNSTWIIHLYKDTIIDVYSGDYVRPFLLVPSSPKDYLKINAIELDKL